MLVYHAISFPGRSFKKSIFWSDIMDSISGVVLSLRWLTWMASKPSSSDLYRAERTESSFQVFFFFGAREQRPGASLGC